MNPVSSRNETCHGSSRRTFIKSFVTGVAPAVAPASVLGAFAPGERVNVGVLGAGGRGNAVAREFLALPDVRIVAVCDAYTPRREKRCQEWNAQYGGDYVTAYVRPDQVLARKDIDAVLIATPDHWHVPLALAAINAGKDVYVEKPLAVSYRLGQTLREPVKRTQRVLQYGTQQRSMPQYRYVCDLVRNGYIGRITHLHAWCPDISEQYEKFFVPQIGSVRPVSPPEDLDFDLWLGPAPKRPYTVDLCTNFGAYHTYDFSLGFIAGWGAHPLDMAQWAMKMDHSGPSYYEGRGSVPAYGLYDTVDQWDITCYYPGNIPLRFMSERFCRETVMKYRRRWSSHGNTFFGTEGWISVDRSGVEASSAVLERIDFKPTDKRVAASLGHVRNFVDCVRSREQPLSTLEAALRSDAISHLANIVVRTKRPVSWDPKKESIEGFPEGEKMLTREQRRVAVL